MSRCRVAALALWLGATFPGAAGPARSWAAGPGPAASPTASPAASPVASVRQDLDRDGARDELRVERDGSLAVVSGRTGRVLAWKPISGAAGAGAERGEIQVATGAAVGGRVVIVAIAIAPGAGGRADALAAEWRAGGLRELWRGAVGPQGADGESTLYIEAGRHGLLRYAGRAGVARCDGKTAHLYAEKFDFAGAGRFRAVDEVPRIPSDAPELVASRAAPAGVAAGARPLDFRVLAASSQLGAGAGDLVAPTEIDDQDPTTAWVEGRGGFGRGEFVTARASMDGGMVRAIRLVPGHAASARSFAEFNRLKRVGLLVGRDRAYRVVFAKDPARGGSPADPYWIKLPEPVAADCVSLVVVEVYAGQGARGAGRTAISELAVLTAMDLAPGGAAAELARAVAAGGRDGEQAARVLARLGPGAEAAVVAEARRPGAPAAAALRLRRVLADLPGGAAELARGLAAARLHPADAERFARALVAIGAPSAAALAEVVGDEKADAAGRSRAAQVLAGIGDQAALRALAGAAGRGPRDLRRAVAHAIGARPAGELDQVVALARAADKDGGAREADLWRAVGLMTRARGGGEARGRAAAAIGQRLTGASGYELRYRLIEAAGGLDEPALVDAVAAELGRRPPVAGSPEAASAAGATAGGAKAAGASSKAAGAGGANASAAGPNAAVTSSKAGGPNASAAGPNASAASAGTRVQRESLALVQAAALRRVAAEALGRSGLPAAGAALVRAARDPDPGVREAAVEALGERARPEGDAALTGQLAGDSWARVRRASAIALGTTCRRPAAAGALRRAALRDADVQVRRASLSSLVNCRAPGAIRFLLAIAADRRAPAELRTHAMRLIGGSGDRAAARPLAALASAELERAFSDESAITPAASSVHALGELGDPAATPVLLHAAEAVAFPEIQAAAATALGRVCPASALPVLRELARSSQHQVAAPARASLRRCSRHDP